MILRIIHQVFNINKGNNMTMQKLLLIVVPIMLVLTGCAPTAKDLIKIEGSSMEERSFQTKFYNTTQEGEILSASVSSLQDMGFNVDEINKDFGVVTCSKSRDARETGQQVGYFVLALFAGANVMSLADHTQHIRATVVTTPYVNKNKASVRLTIQRVMYNHQGNVINVETVKDAVIYQAFFEKLSKAIFLEANNL